MAPNTFNEAQVAKSLRVSLNLPLWIPPIAEYMHYDNVGS